MLYDEDGLYFLTAKGKSLYERLTAAHSVSDALDLSQNACGDVSSDVRGNVQGMALGLSWALRSL